MNAPDLDAIAARRARRTSGKWYVQHNPDGMYHMVCREKDGSIVCSVMYRQDAEFVAAAPADIAALLGEVERLRKAMRQIESEKYDFAAMYPAYAELMDKIEATEAEAKECADCEREKEWYPGEVFMGKRFYGGCKNHRHLLNHLKESSERFYDRLRTLAPIDVARKALEGIPK